MNRRFGAFAATVAFLLVVLPRGAYAQEQPSSRTRLYLGPRATVRSDVLSIDDRDETGQAGSTHYALSGAFRYRLVPWLSAEVNASIGRNPSRWSERRGETRSRVDFAVGPVFGGTLRDGTLHSQAFQVAWRLGFTLGYARAWFEPGPSTLVEESYRNGHGLTFDIIAGLDLYFGRHGVYADLGFGGSSLWIRRRAVLKSDPLVRSDEQFHYSGASGTVGGGYTYRF